MKEAIGNSMVFNFIIIFTSIFIVLMIGSLSYTKAFKVRNRIIDIIESHQGYNQEASDEIDENLRAIGYSMVDSSCGEHNGVSPMTNNSVYPYCIYEHSSTDNVGGISIQKGKYYGVKVFIKIDIPLIGGFIKIPLYGETRVIIRKAEVEG